MARLPWRRVLLLIALVGLVIVMLSGCTETRGTRQAETDKSDTVTVSGTAHVPGIGSVPLQLHIERSGSESLREESESKTKIDSAAIAQQVAAVVGKSFDAAIAKVTGLQPSGPTPTEGGLLGGLGGLALLAGREWLARRREEKALAEVKAARDRAQAEALELAKQVPPPLRDTP
jgi:hypothetical protein